MPSYGSSSQAFQAGKSLTQGGNAAMFVDPATACGKCGIKGHKVVQCFYTDADGFVIGCSICNNEWHLTENCPEIKDLAVSERLNRLWPVMVLARANMPPLAAVEYDWVADARQHGLSMDGYPYTPTQAKRWASESPLLYLNYDHRAKPLEESEIRTKGDMAEADPCVKNPTGLVGGKLTLAG